MISYLVSSFEKETLSNLVKECFGYNFPDIFKKQQIDYIYRYLKDMKTTSVLLEPKYIDKDYLEDYNHYYIKCFGNNGAMSARLHFFSSEIDHQKMTDILTNNSPDDIKSLQDSYLGFIVIKPLEKTFIGKTCLKPYCSFNAPNGLKHCLTRKYQVDLFGIALTVNSVAFQEQDKVVSACATTAIWSSLHAMYWKNVREIRSCSEITTNAINHINNSSNSFPNRELSNKQILRALDFEQLKHHSLDIQNHTYDDFFTIIKSHIDSRIPLILGVDVYSRDNKALRHLDGHAITVVGYKLDTNPAIYVHDDRLGPYAKASLIDLSKYEKTPQWGLSLQEKKDDGSWEEPHEYLTLNSLIVPTPAKVRLPSTYAHNTCSHILKVFDAQLDRLAPEHGENNIAQYRGELTFELSLKEISEIRQALHQQNFIGDPDEKQLLRDKVKFLTGSYARYHWVANFYFQSKPIFTVLFDATDIPQGDAVTAIFTKNSELTNLILDEHRDILEHDPSLSDVELNSFYGSFLKYLQPKSDNLYSYLEKTYGELRAPKYIKSTEISNGDIIDSAVDKYYQSVEKTLNELYPDIDADSDTVLIWTISNEGALLVAKEEKGKGHPTLTGFKPSRIAGELKRTNQGWFINSKSGRYSTDYINVDELLNNAADKFKDIFRNSRDEIFVERLGN